MSEYTPQDLHYDQSFKAFLAATNEKDAIVTALAERVVQPASSLLDIGAGDGTMSRRLIDRFHPKVYTAIEANETFCDTLMGSDIRIVRGTYPAADSRLGDERYDTVLSIYSAPLTVEARRDFLTQAFRRTAPDTGALAVVSFGQTDAWTEMVTEISGQLPPMPSDMDVMATIGSHFAVRLGEECMAFGDVDVSYIDSEIATDSPEALYYAVAFTATAGLRHILEYYSLAKDDIVKIIERHAPTGKLAQSHSVITVRRNGNDDA